MFDYFFIIFYYPVKKFLKLGLNFIDSCMQNLLKDTMDIPFTTTLWLAEQ